MNKEELIEYLDLGWSIQQIANKYNQPRHYINKWVKLFGLIPKYSPKGKSPKNLLEQYNWNEIQLFYNNNKTWRDVAEKFNLNMRLLSIAKKKGLFISRKISEATALSRKLHPIKLSEETKRKISESRKKFLKEHPDKVPYLLNHYSKGDSYPEQFFDKYLINYIKKYHFETYQLDFAHIEKKIDLEIDGDQHFLDKRIIEHDKRRNLFLIELGWTVIRLRWSKFQTKTIEEKIILLEKLNNFDFASDDCILVINSNPSQEKIDAFFAKKERIYKKSFCECGCSKSLKAVRCDKCNRKIYTKRPEWNVFEPLKDFRNADIARYFNVSWNIVKKWRKYYEKIGHVGGSRNLTKEA